MSKLWAVEYHKIVPPGQPSFSKSAAIVQTDTQAEAESLIKGISGVDKTTVVAHEMGDRKQPVALLIENASVETFVLRRATDHALGEAKE